MSYSLKCSLFVYTCRLIGGQFNITRLSYQIRSNHYKSFRRSKTSCKPEKVFLEKT